MEKALEMLTGLRQAKSYDENYPTDYEIQEAIEELKAKNERIKELEEAMKPKTCEGCKHYEEKQCTNENSIAFGGINAVYKDDFCNDFEPKEQL